WRGIPGRQENPLSNPSAPRSPNLTMYDRPANWQQDVTLSKRSVVSDFVRVTARPSDAACSSFWTKSEVSNRSIQFTLLSLAAARASSQMASGLDTFPKMAISVSYDMIDSVQFVLKVKWRIAFDNRFRLASDRLRIPNTVFPLGIFQSTAYAPIL